MIEFEIYVLNLDKDKYRLKEITKNLYPNKFKRISGIYGKQIDMNDFSEIYTSSKYLSPKSAIGSELSHKKATKEFLNNSNLDYALILEDDAVPANSNYMEEIRISIKNAPNNWDIIKLDYWPVYSSNYNTYPSLVLTAYIINKRSAKKILDYKVLYYYDIMLNFTTLKIYNNPNIVFKQIWDENNQSNARNNNSYNPISLLYTGLDFKIIRIFNIEFTIADILLLLIIIIIFRIGCYYYFSKNIKKIRKISKFK